MSKTPKQLQWDWLKVENRAIKSWLKEEKRWKRGVIRW